MKLIKFLACLFLLSASAPAKADPGGVAFGSVVSGNQKTVCVYGSIGGACLPFLVANLTAGFYSIGGNYVQNVPPTAQGNFMSSGSASVSLCQTIGCNPGASYATNLTQMTTVGDGTRQEIAHAIGVYNNSGYRYSADSINNGVEGMFIGVLGQTNGAKTWGQATDVVLESGWHSNFAAIAEFDMANNAYDCPPGGTGPDGQTCNIFGAWVSGYVGNFPSTSAIFVAPSGGGPGFAHHWGIAFEGGNTIKEATFVDGTNSQQTFFTSGNHSIAVLNDSSTTPAGINLAGNYTLSAITTQSSNAPNALFTKAGQKICFNTTNDCMFYEQSTDRLVFTGPSGRVASIGMTNGNLILKGGLTSSGNP